MYTGSLASNRRDPVDVSAGIVHHPESPAEGLRRPFLNVVVFDMDGTLANNDEVAIEAARDGLREYWTARGRSVEEPSADFIRSLVGLPSREYFGRMLPPERAADVEGLATRIEEHEAERLARGEGARFDGVDSVLSTLRREGWRIALVSNCQRRYFEANLEYVLDRRWFDVALCLSDRPTKIENVRDAIARITGGSGPTFGAMVGDRATDVEAGRASDLRCIGCLYGFGSLDELASADETVSSIRDVPDVLRRGAARGT
jgi:phosphoglycolate phosphatase-like HAD superfamily hydrolase